MNGCFEGAKLSFEKLAFERFPADKAKADGEARTRPLRGFATLTRQPVRGLTL